jgi:Transcriptional regulators
LREGLEILEAEGRIWRHVGKGTFVGPRPLQGATGLDLVSAMTSPEEVLEVRLLFEPLIARLAATRATAPEIENIERLLEKSDGARDAKTWELWDGTLHRAVAQAAHNKLLPGDLRRLQRDAQPGGLEPAAACGLECGAPWRLSSPAPGLCRRHRGARSRTGRDDHAAAYRDGEE